jgi:hypothetical protein
MGSRLPKALHPVRKLCRGLFDGVSCGRLTLATHANGPALFPFIGTISRSRTSRPTSRTSTSKPASTSGSLSMLARTSTAVLSALMTRVSSLGGRDTVADGLSLGSSPANVCMVRRPGLRQEVLSVRYVFAYSKDDYPRRTVLTPHRCYEEHARCQPGQRPHEPRRNHHVSRKLGMSSNYAGT